MKNYTIMNYCGYYYVAMKGNNPTFIRRSKIISTIFTN